MPDHLCAHHRDPHTCRPCRHRATTADALGLPDLAHHPRHPQARPCGCCDLPIEPADPVATTVGGETVHRSCTTGGAR